MVHKFFKVHQIKYKKANLICGLHMALKPLITHDFLIQLKNEASNFTALQIWNCDKTSFPTDVGQCKVKAPKWKQPNKLTSVMGRANISAFATCSASGKGLDQFITFFTCDDNLQVSYKCYVESMWNKNKMKQIIYDMIKFYF